MNRKFLLAAAFLSATFVFAREAPSKLITGKNGLHAEFLRFDKNAPDFQGLPVLFNESSRQFSNAEARN